VTDIDYSEPAPLEAPDMDAIEATRQPTNGHVASTDPDWTIANGVPEMPERETDEPPQVADEDIPFAPELRMVRSRLVDGGTFIRDVPAIIPAIWKDDTSGIAWAKGEGLMLVGPDGVGKTSIAQQLVLARAGIRTGLLGMEVDRRPAASSTSLPIAHAKQRVPCGG
jgi:hypothetical protein